MRPDQVVAGWDMHAGRHPGLWKGKVIRKVDNASFCNFMQFHTDSGLMELE